MTAVKEEALQFALDFIGETFTMCNDVLRESPVRRAMWEVVRTDEKTLITSIGSVRYEKTLFMNKKNGERKYMVDAAMGIDSHERISEDAVAQMLEETVQTCYRKGGEAVSIHDMFVDRREKSITKASVMAAYRKVKELGGEVIGPKQLGVFGASYVWPVILKMGIVENHSR